MSTNQYDKFRPERFGYNLGFSNRAWIKKYGVAWQFKLSDAILNPDKAEYKGMTVPRSRRMVWEAQMFQHHNYTRNVPVEKWVWDPVLKKLKGQDKSFNFPHHTLINTQSDDSYRFKILYGHQKTLDPNAKAAIDLIKTQIKFEPDKKKVRELKKEIRVLQAEGKGLKWRDAAARAGHDVELLADSQLRIVRSLTEEAKRRDERELEKLFGKRELKREISWEKDFGGRDPGTSIGESEGDDKDESDGTRYDAFLKFFARARWLKANVFYGILDPAHKNIKRLIREHFGERKLREMILGKDSYRKYATDKHYPPGSEYGTMKDEYEEWELTPLNRRQALARKLGMKNSLPVIDD